MAKMIKYVAKGLQIFFSLLEGTRSYVSFFLLFGAIGTVVLWQERTVCESDLFLLAAMYALVISIVTDVFYYVSREVEGLLPVLLRFLGCCFAFAIIRWYGLKNPVPYSSFDLELCMAYVFWFLVAVKCQGF